MSQWAERQCGETCLNGNTEDYISSVFSLGVYSYFNDIWLKNEWYKTGGTVYWNIFLAH